MFGSEENNVKIPTRSVALTGAVLLALAMAGVVSGVSPAGAASPESLAVSADRPAPSLAIPTVTGPIAGKDATEFTTFPLSTVGYKQSEYFFSGNATEYASTAPLTSNGRWSVTPSTQAPYKSAWW